MLSVTALSITINYIKGAVIMNIEKLKEYWTAEEEKAVMNGWDFSHIENRYSMDELPWDMTELIYRYMKKTDRLLDIDTGGGEFLISLGHPPLLTSATEGWKPNVELCREKLGGLGIDFREMTDYSAMPFNDGQFDIITDRHGSYDASEIFRVLKHGGVFITQQVGDRNDRELVELLLPDVQIQFAGNNLSTQSEIFRNAGFEIAEQNEVFRPIKFYDSGALVWFARVIEWEFVSFSVEKCFDRLLDAERIIQENGSVDGSIHRFCFVAMKP